jgi:hypothetical protein
MRSCSLSVLVDLTAKQVTSVHRDPLMLADEGQIGRWIRRLQSKRSVRAMPVVVLDIDPQDLLQVASPDDQQPVQAFGADRPNPTLRVSVRIGRLHRREQHLGPSERNTSSKVRQNFASRSRSKKRTRRPRSPSTSSRFRACWATQAPSGLAVTPPRWTRRVSSSMKNSTYSRRSQALSTVKKSHPTMPAACWRRKARQVVVARSGVGSSL